MLLFFVLLKYVNTTCMHVQGMLYADRVDISYTAVFPPLLAIGPNIYSVKGGMSYR